MNKYKYLYLFWLLPASFLFLIVQQALVYDGLIATYKNGTSYTAEIEDMKIEQVGAQTNGQMVLIFTNKEGKRIEKKMSLPVEMAGKLQQTRIIPIRYKPGAFQEVVIMTTYKTQKDLTWSNIAIASIGFLITLMIALYAHNIASSKLSDDNEELIIERVD